MAVISPLLANLYLHWFDALFYGPQGPGRGAESHLVRYADDFVAMAKQMTAETSSLSNRGWKGSSSWRSIFASGTLTRKIIFNPNEAADNMRKYGGFIPGIRPGKNTADYMNKILTRITVVGTRRKW